MTRCCQVVFQAVMQLENCTRSYEKVESFGDADMAARVQMISQWVIRTGHHLRESEEASTPSGYAPLMDDELSSLALSPRPHGPP